MSTTESVTAAETRGSLALWFGVLGAPLAWAAQLVVNYALEDPLTCAPGAATPGVLLGMDIERWLAMITAALVAVAFAALVVSIRCYRRLRDDATIGGRARWMAFAGIVNSSIFLLPIALGFASPLLLDSCRPAS